MSNVEAQSTVLKWEWIATRHRSGSDKSTKCKNSENMWEKQHKITWEDMKTCENMWKYVENTWKHV